MKKNIFSVFTGTGFFFFAYWWGLAENRGSFSETEIGFESDIDQEILVGANGRYTLEELENWRRPEGPVRVGIQSGHWKVEEVPGELEGLKRNGAGATGGGTNERDAVLAISNLIVEILEEEEIETEVLPVTIPPGYLADAFVSVHADGNRNSSVSGFKVASPRRDYSGRSIFLEEYIYDQYQAATGLSTDPNITWGMRGYYAFNWRRYEHAIHPMTPAVIVETGFLTSPVDQEIIINNPEKAAKGIAEGVINFLESEGLLKKL